jgi:hypothetical protein
LVQELGFGDLAKVVCDLYKMPVVESYILISKTNSHCYCGVIWTNCTKDTMGTGTLGVDNTLRNTLSVKVG